MFIINNKVDFTLIKFPIIFPLIYFFILNLTPQYETYLIDSLYYFLQSLILVRHGYYTFNKVNKTHLKKIKSI